MKESVKDQPHPPLRNVYAAYPSEQRICLLLNLRICFICVYGLLATAIVPKEEFPWALSVDLKQDSARLSMTEELRVLSWTRW